MLIDGRNISDGILESAVDDRYRVTARGAKEELVSLGGEILSCILTYAGVAEGNVAVLGYEEGADVVVVMLLMVVACLAAERVALGTVDKPLCIIKGEAYGLGGIKAGLAEVRILPENLVNYRTAAAHSRESGNTKVGIYAL